MDTEHGEHREIARLIGDLRRAERERDDLRAEHAADCDLIARQAAILTAVADALKGPPPALRTHSHHDLGAAAAATVAQQAPLLDAHDALVAAARAAGWMGAGATGAELVAWVRRGEREAALAACERVLAVSDTAMLGRSRDAVCLGARRCVVAIRALPLDAPGGAS